MMAGPRDEDDPFACFDTDDDELDTVDAIASDLLVTNMRRRDADAGVLAFHAGTEQALVTHVENQCTSQEDLSTQVLKMIDAFCLERHWMMHVGPEKAMILKSFLEECVANKKNMQFILAELGTYCGYSSIMFAQTLLEIKGLSDFHIYTVEVNSQHATVAKRLIRLAKLEQHITVLRLDMATTENQLINLLRSRLGDSMIDFLFLDHDKDAYLSDLKRLEEAGLISKGTYVAADNVIFAQIDDYRGYINELASMGVVESKLVKAQLEYSAPDATESNETKLQDGIGEFMQSLRRLYLKRHSDIYIAFRAYNLHPRSYKRARCKAKKRDDNVDHYAVAVCSLQWFNGLVSLDSLA